MSAGVSALGPSPRASPAPRASSPGPTVGHSVLSLPLSPLPDLEQKILRVLRDAGSPVKTARLVKECQVPKKNLNQVLYRMKEGLQVALAGPATWCLGDGGSGDVPSAEGARPGRGNCHPGGFTPSRSNPGAERARIWARV